MRLLTDLHQIITRLDEVLVRLENRDRSAFLASASRIWTITPEKRKAVCDRSQAAFQWRRRELHPKSIFHKAFLRKILATSMGASGCTMSALRRHCRSLSSLGMAWHRKSGKRSWDWRDLLKCVRGD